METIYLSVGLQSQHGLYSVRIKWLHMLFLAQVCLSCLCFLCWRIVVFYFFLLSEKILT